MCFNSMSVWNVNRHTERLLKENATFTETKLFHKLICKFLIKLTLLF